MLSGGGDASSLDSEEEATENLWNQNVTITVVFLPNT